MKNKRRKRGRKEGGDYWNGTKKRYMNKSGSSGTEEGKNDGQIGWGR